MCNCGEKRMEYSHHSHPGNTSKVIRPQTSSYACFEYTGKTAFRINGNITGKEYVFSSPGSRQDVDYRDIPPLITIPILRRVK